MKSFYLIGGVAVAIGAIAAVAVFAADTPAAKAPAGVPVAKAAPAAPAKPERKIERRVERLAPPSFAEVDANHDGTISPAEFDAFHATHKPGLREEGPGAGGPPPMMRMERRFGGRGGPGMEPHGDSALDLLDTNNDGKLTFDEMTAPLKRHFERMDADHDGSLSRDEMEKGRGHFEGPPPPEQ